MTKVGNNKLAESVARKMEQRIIDLGWPVGTVLGSEADLLGEYGVSRAVLREAVRLLEHHGVAAMRRGPGGGLLVTEPDPRAVIRALTLYLDHQGVAPHQLFETRTAIELAVVEQACRNIDEEGIERLRAALEREAEEFEGELSLHQLHLTIADLTGNPAMRLFVEVLAHLTAERAISEAREPERRPDVARRVHRAHRGLVEAIVAGDAALARHRMLRHLEAMRGWVATPDR